MRKSVSGRLASWLEEGVGLFSQACGVVERAVERLVTPITDEVTTLRRDLDAAARGEGDSAVAGPARLPARRQLANLRQVAVGREYGRKLRELAGENAVVASEEERAATRQLIVGVATLGVNLLAFTAYPALYAVAIGGVVYQLLFPMRQAYRTLSEERRVGAYGVSLIILAGSLFTGSITALSLAVFSTTFLRYIVARQEGHAGQNVTAALADQPRSVFLVVGDAEVEIPLNKLQTDDVIAVSAGQVIPVDGVVVAGYAAVDQRMLTGESLPADKMAGDRVLSSSVLLQGRLHIRVQLSGQETVAALAARTLAGLTDYTRELSRRAERQQDRLVMPMLALAGATGVMWGADSALAALWTMPGQRMLFLGPLTMWNFMQVAARRGILVKSGRALERLHQVDTVVFDKTGTLTQDQPEVCRVHLFADLSESELLSLAAIAERGQTHPIARALQQAALSGGSEPPRATALAPAETVVTLGRGLSTTVAGERIHLGSRRLMADLGVENLQRADGIQDDAHRRGHSLLYVAREGVLLGAIDLRPAVRPEAGALINELQRRGKQVLLISGDEEGPTSSLAAQLGIGTYYAAALPEDKSNLIARLQGEGRVVCYVGDGINDSLALRRADVSVSIKTASTMATSMSSVVLMHDDLGQLIPFFDMAGRFEHYMRANRISSNLPAFAVLGGTMVFGWSFLTAVLLGTLTLPLAFRSLLQAAGEDQAAPPPNPPNAR